MVLMFDLNWRCCAVEFVFVIQQLSVLIQIQIYETT